MLEKKKRMVVRQSWKERDALALRIGGWIGDPFFLPMQLARSEKRSADQTASHTKTPAHYQFDSEPGRKDAAAPSSDPTKFPLQSICTKVEVL